MRTLTRWNPMHEAMNQMVRRSASGWSNQDGGECMMCLPIDAYSTDNEIIVTAALAGVMPENVEITVEGDTLTIKGEIPEAIENVDYMLNERYHGPFSRTLQLNTAIDVDNIEANFDGGVLTLTLPKSEEVRPKQIIVTAVNAK